MAKIWAERKNGWQKPREGGQAGNGEELDLTLDRCLDWYVDSLRCSRGDARWAVGNKVWLTGERGLSGVFIGSHKPELSVVLEKTLESPLDCKKIQPVQLKGNQSWIFIVRTDAEAETPILWPPDAKNWLIWKDPDAGKDWRWEEKDRGWDGWLTSPTWWTWVWASFGSWWWTWKPGVLQSIGSQRVGHDWVTELNWTEGLQGLVWASSGRNLVQERMQRDSGAKVPDTWILKSLRIMAKHTID